MIFVLYLQTVRGKFVLMLILALKSGPVRSSSPDFRVVESQCRKIGRSKLDFSDLLQKFHCFLKQIKGFFQVRNFSSTFIRFQNIYQNKRSIFLNSKKSTLKGNSLLYRNELFIIWIRSYILVWTLVVSMKMNSLEIIYRCYSRL